ncbi:unnamed protein product [Trifolium pratense]|uniref:Uncharacterized protein n=1 Tax=Trifolium pratense TaxID=57577 RepID=A0ACB0IJW2_TRIPR|nr:unnamed protein product [Trifolium pratense]
MADKYSLSIIGEMDRLWYHQIILFSKPTTLLLATKVEKHVTISESSSSTSSSILSLPPLVDEETSTDESSLSSHKQVSSESITSLPLQDCSIDNKEEIKEILDKMSLLSCSQSSCSSLPPTGNRRKKSKKQGKLQKSMSCRPFGELELDEVKGFMDLGFQFKKEYISPRMISVVPGLQRLCLLQSESQSQLMDDGTENDDDIVEVYEDEEEEKRDIMRPYLSEAWLIKRPDSPLLNLKVPKTCSADNMKKHLRFWAKTVASEIKQE